MSANDGVPLKMRASQHRRPADPGKLHAHCGVIKTQNSYVVLIMRSDALDEKMMEAQAAFKVRRHLVPGSESLCNSRPENGHRSRHVNKAIDLCHSGVPMNGPGTIEG